MRDPVWVVRIHYIGPEGLVFNTWRTGVTKEQAIKRFRRRCFRNVKIISTEVTSGDRPRIPQLPSAPIHERIPGWAQRALKRVTLEKKLNGKKVLTRRGRPRSVAPTTNLDAKIFNSLSGKDRSHLGEPRAG